MKHRMPSNRRLMLLSGVAAAAFIATAACTSESDEPAAPAAVATTAATTVAEDPTPTIEISVPEPVLMVEDLRARATPGLENENSAAYARITNSGTAPDRLIAASVDKSIANRVELHTTVREGDMMRMVQVDGWEIAPGETLELMPGGNHIMFIGIAQQFVVGDTFSLTLTFEQGGDVTLDVPIVEIAAMGMGGSEGGMQPSPSPMP